VKLDDIPTITKSEIKIVIPILEDRINKIPKGDALVRLAVWISIVDSLQETLLDSFSDKKLATALFTKVKHMVKEATVTFAKVK